MKVRLAGGVVASRVRVWIPGRPDPVELTEEPALPLGEAVALGPGDASPEQVRHAVDELTRLVQAGGAVAAGAGVDLGPGFRSARLAGARGDQRDAVLAALRVLGLAQVGRLGQRAGFGVALFGPAATKRVGAAAAAAIGEGRWAAVQLASAASDLLGPEQLEQVLALRAPEGIDLVQGPPSALAQHLRQVLEPLPGPRRLELLLDLWARVEERQAWLARRQRRLATQSRRSRVADLRERRRRDDDEQILEELRADFGEPSLADAARWMRPSWSWNILLHDLVQDALAATALLRTAVAVADHGLEDGLAHSAALLSAAEALIHESAAAWAARKVPGLTGLPSRPGSYVRDIHRRLSGDKPRDHRFAAYVRPRLASARDFALVIIETARVLLSESSGVPADALRHWSERVHGLWDWRKQAGYSAVRPPAGWDGMPAWTVPLLGDHEPISQRLAAAPGSDACDLEVAGDLLWYADLIDALAALYGHDAAQETPGFPWFEHDPPPPHEPLSPRLDSVTLAVAGAAQLVALGGTPPERARTWPAFTGGLLASTAVSEALTGEFAVPAPLAALDAATVSGTGLRLRVARNARTLAEWSAYMGNCIAGEDYIGEATPGRSVLIGLYDKDGVLVVNAQLVRRRPAARGWRVEEIKARFNEPPGEALERRVRDWAGRLPGAPAGDAVAAGPDEPAPARALRRSPVPRLVEDAGPALGALAKQAWAEQIDAQVLGAFAALAGTAPDAALARLRRLGPAALASACRCVLDAGTLGLGQLWAASSARPLRAALAALDPALRGRFDQLPLLLDDPPLPKSLRRLVKLPEIGDAYALDLAGRRARRAIGQLASRDDPVIASALSGRTAEPLLCALTVMIICVAPGIDLAPVAPPRAVTVPGYPATTLDDENGPWQRALPDARELGADTGAFGDQIAEHGLRVPASWLTAGGWPALWARAHRGR